MHIDSPRLAVLLAVTLAAAAVAAAPAAARPKPHAPARKPAAAAQPVAPAVASEPPAEAVAEALTEQVLAAELVHYGRYGCEFNQSLVVKSSGAHLAYVELAFGPRVFLMRPVLSSTGAVRLEDVRGETLAVQIPVKSMLFDVREGRRLADECISAPQAEWIEADRETRALAARAAALPLTVAPAAAESAEVPASGAPG